MEMKEKKEREGKIRGEKANRREIKARNVKKLKRRKTRSYKTEQQCFHIFFHQFSCLKVRRVTVHLKVLSSSR